MFRKGLCSTPFVKHGTDYNRLPLLMILTNRHSPDDLTNVETEWNDIAIRSDWINTLL